MRADQCKIGGKGGIMSVYIRTQNRNTGGVFVRKGGGPGTCKRVKLVFWIIPEKGGHLSDQMRAVGWVGPKITNTAALWTNKKCSPPLRVKHNCRQISGEITWMRIKEHLSVILLKLFTRHLGYWLSRVTSSPGCRDRLGVAPTVPDSCRHLNTE